MTEPLPLPIRVLVEGASTVTWTSYMGGPRTDMAFPRAAEAAMYRAGRPAEVRVNALASQPVRLAIRGWEAEIGTWSPDVVVLMYGHFESIHYLLPRWLERHAQSMRGRPGRVREAYRKGVLKPSWRRLATLQQRLDRELPSTAFAHRPRRAAADLQRLVERALTVASPLVLVMEIPPPGRRFLEWFPGIGERIEVMNRALADVVTRIDRPDVRTFPVTEVIGEIFERGEDATPDGGHFTPEAHRLVGEALAREILDWAATQEHLK
ncbi:MAG: SGNH/GDSL hydrolase family protein [Marmoricola sp.]